jgi:hypothetical protein
MLTRNTVQIEDVAEKLITTDNSSPVFAVSSHTTFIQTQTGVTVAINLVTVILLHRLYNCHYDMVVSVILLHTGKLSLHHCYTWDKSHLDFVLA